MSRDVIHTVTMVIALSVSLVSVFHQPSSEPHITPQTFHIQSASTLPNTVTKPPPKFIKIDPPIPPPILSQDTTTPPRIPDPPSKPTKSSIENDLEWTFFNIIYMAAMGWKICFQLTFNFITYPIYQSPTMTYITISTIIALVQYYIVHTFHHYNHTPAKIHEPESILSILDAILCVYYMYLNQYIISTLFVILIILNIHRQVYRYLQYHFPIIEHMTEIVHTTLQLLPISLSIAFYETNDRIIDIAFISVFTCFMYSLYLESSKFSRIDDNNMKMVTILLLCVVLDYINVIMLILCKLYVTNNYIFYQFMIPIEGFGITLICCVFYSELAVYRGPRYYINSLFESQVFSKIWRFFGFCTALLLAIPFFLENVNASWLIFVYHKFLKPLRHATSFNEKLKDQLVAWLQRDQQDLLIKYKFCWNKG